VQLNKNVVNGTETVLRLIGDLPSGTPVAFEAAFGWGWLVRLLEEYGFDRCGGRFVSRSQNSDGGNGDVLVSGHQSHIAWVAGHDGDLAVGR
jgi:hypothetical protein